MSRIPRLRIVSLLTLLLLLQVHAGCSGGGELPEPFTSVSLAESAEEAAIARQPVCVASTVWSAGVLAPKLYYRRAHLPDGRLVIGYYAFFSDERPWGNNWLTWLVLPAVALDLVYTRAVFFLPGLRRILHGKGDVEGFRVVYDVDEALKLTPVEAFADDGQHQPVHLELKDLFSIDPARLTVATNVWSHQFGAKGAKREDVVYRRCFGAGTIQPLTGGLVRDFNLAGRALPAAVGELATAPALHAALSP